MAPGRELLLDSGGDALDTRRDRGRHAYDVVDADTPPAVRPSTVRNRHDRPVGKVAGAWCGDALDDRAHKTHQVYGVVRPDSAVATSRDLCSAPSSVRVGEYTGVGPDFVEMRDWGGV
jgi:hypothetical protein